jgi:chemotaxis protein methyltransferase CheR
MHLAVEPVEETPPEVLADPALLFLYHRVEQILGIKAPSKSLLNLNNYLEKNCGASFIENPAAHERILTSREHVFEISKLVTINETYFFREGAHFSLLVNQFLPSLSKFNRPIRICSAATSIGCEAYSIAMLLDYHAKNGSAGSFEFEIDAFDVSAAAIETAKSARYTTNTLRSDGADWKYILDLYLLPDGVEFIISRAIRDKVRFFAHNIMNSLNKQYDVVFFRNAMIYFSNQTRHKVMDTLAASLFNGGLLFLGVSETSSVRHPLLLNKCLSDVFYFQKTAQMFDRGYVELEQKNEASKARKADPVPAKKQRHWPETAMPEQVPHENADPAAPRVRNYRNSEGTAVTVLPEDSGQVQKNGEYRVREPVRKKHGGLAINCEEAALILEKDEGREDAQKILAQLENAGGEKISASGGVLAAAAISFLSTEDLVSAALVLSYLEQYNSGAVTQFLRGEYNVLDGNTREAEKNFEEAAAADRTFWPAFYRLCSLAAHGNRTRYEYKVKKALESLELGKDLHYECFIGGFSPDYFRKILDRKLA